jgi:hypothetical protein
MQARQRERNPHCARTGSTDELHDRGERTATTTARGRRFG